MQNLLQDVRYSLRQLRKSPGFTAVATVTLALGIGANVVVFGVLNALLLRPLDVPHPEQVYTLQHRAAQDLSMSYPDYRDVRERNTVFSALAMYRVARIGLEAPDGAHPVWGYEASGNYFDMLGVKPLLGNFFHASAEGAPGASPFVVLSYNCWKDRFASDPGIVNKVIRLNKHPFTVIAVAPRGFNGVERFYWPEVWVPITNVKEIEGYNWIQNRSDQNAWVAGRLKQGVTPQQAEANLNSIAAQLAREYPGTDEHLSFRLSKPGFLGDTLGGPLRGFMFGLMLLAALVLLASCANLGGLFAARASDRSRELAIRMAIGSTRPRIFRQLLTEATVVSLAGGVLALLLGNILLNALTQWHPPTDFPIQFVVQPNWLVYFFAFAAALVTGLIFGAVPARQIWNADPNQALRGGSLSPILGQRWALRDALLAVQIALCCLLVTASFVSLRGLARTFQLPLGFNPEGVTLAAFDLQLANYNSTEAGVVQQRLLEQVAKLPGVTAAAYGNSVPLSIDQSSTSIFAEGTKDFRASTQKLHATFYQVSPGYFTAIGAPLLAGRDITLADNAKAPKVAVVNETFARKLTGSTQDVGKRFIRGDSTIEIVGIVPDGKYQTLTENPEPAVFFPIAQSSNTSTVLVVRSRLSSAEMIPAIRQAIANVDASIPVFSISSWQDALGLMLLPARAATIALGIFGALAMMLAVTGIFGLASYTVSKRIRELGIRMALGAQSKEVLRAALGRTFALLLVGSCAGLLLGFAASKLLASIVYQASASDPVVLVAVVATMALAGLASAFLPARRALSIHPMELLREE